MAFIKATKKQAKLRIALDGASGSGKTYSALMLATSLSKKIAFIDTEKGSASLYADKFNFDVLELSAPFTPERFIEAIKEAENSGYEVIIIDSITHEWNGPGGILEILNGLGGRFTDWAKVTPRHNKFMNAMLFSSSHIIATMRSKADYSVTKENGTTKVEKQGTAPEQRDGVDFEFTIVFSLNQRHYATATKDRTGLFDGKDFIITSDTGKEIIDWLNTGELIENKPTQDFTPTQPEKTTIQEDMISLEIEKFNRLYQDKFYLEGEDLEKIEKTKNFLDTSDRQKIKQYFNWLIKQNADFETLINTAKVTTQTEPEIDDVDPDTLNFGEVA